MVRQLRAVPDRPHQTIPGLDPGTRYFSRLSARSALYTELHLLLDGLYDCLPATGYRTLVMEKNRLARESTSARRKLWEELRSRYLLDCYHPLFAAFWSEWRRCKSEPERGLTAYILFALNDRLVADLGTEWLFPRVRQASSQIQVEDVLSFIKQSANRHPEVTCWSAETLKSVAKHYMASIRDFGLAEGKIKKKTIRPALSAAPLRLLVRALRLTGAKPMELIQARIFRLLGLDGSEVIKALTELNRRGKLRFKMQADVVELELEAAQ